MSIEPNDTWGTDNEDIGPNDTWGTDNEDIGPNDMNIWEADNFTKINTFLNNGTFNLDISFNAFVHMYELDDTLKLFLIYNIKYYNKFNIKLDLDSVSMFTMCLANKPIENTKDYKKYLKRYFKICKSITYKDIELICFNIIDSKNVELFKYVCNKYSLYNLINLYGINTINNFHKSTIDYNILNHSLNYSTEIFLYIFNNYKFNIFTVLFNHVSFNLYIDNFNQSINDISNKIVDFYKLQQNCSFDLIFNNFMKSCVENKYYNELVENIVLKINIIELYEEYISSCIKEQNVSLIRKFIQKRQLILSSLSYIEIVHDLISLFNNRINNLTYNENSILKYGNYYFH